MLITLLISQSRHIWYNVRRVESNSVEKKKTSNLVAEGALGYPEQLTHRIFKYGYTNGHVSWYFVMYILCAFNMQQYTVGDHWL